MRGIESLSEAVAKNSIVAFSLRIASNVVGIVTTILLTRGMGIDSYGVFALLMSIIVISAKVSMFGMNNGMLRFFPVLREDAGDLKGLMVSAFWVVLLLSLLIMAMHYYGAGIYADRIFQIGDLEAGMRVFVLVLPLMALTQLIASCFQADKDILKFLTLGDLYQKVFFLLMIAGLFYGGFQFQQAVLAFCVSVVIVFGMAGFYFVRRFFYVLKSEKAVYRFKALINFSAPSFLIGFSFILLMQVDRIMVGMFMESADVGLYSVCARVAILMNILLSSFNTAFVPLISGLFFDGRKEELAVLYKAVTKWVWISSIMLFAGFFFLSDHILGVFGKDFVAGSPAFIVLSFCFLLNSGFGSNGFMLQMTGKQYAELINSSLILVLNIGLNVLFIPRFGILGAALATGLSLILMNLARLVELFFIMGLHPFGSGWIKAGVGFGICLSAALFLETVVGGGLGGRIFVWCVFLVLFGAGVYFTADEYDKNLITRKFREISGLKTRIG